MIFAIIKKKFLLNSENIDLSPIIEQGLPLDAFRSEDLARFIESFSDHQNQLVFPTLTDEQKVIKLGGTRVIYDRVWNRKNYFEIAALLNFERGTSRAGNSNENKNISVAAKCNITLNFPALDIPHSIGRKAGISK